MSLENDILGIASSFIVITLLFLLIQYHWRRLHLYTLSSKINGPPAWPIIGSALYFTGNTKDILDAITDLFNTYDSPVKVWLGQKLFFGIARPEQLEIVLNSPHALEKDTLYHFSRPLLGDSVFNASVPKWRRHRKIISPTFNPKVLNSFIPIFQEQAKILVKNLGEHDGKDVFDVFPLVSQCTLDIVWETAMGYKINAQSGNSKYVEWINTLLEIIYMRMFKLWLHPDFIYNMTDFYRRQKLCVDELNEMSISIIKKKIAEYRENKSVSPKSEQNEFIPKRKAFLDYLIQLSEEGADFTNKEILDEVNTLEIAGNDSTATTNSFVFVMLGMHPEIQDKVHEEQESIFQNEDRPITNEDLSNMKYLEKVIKETLRLYPVGPVIVRALTDDIKLDGHTLPKGSSCVLGILQVHRCIEFWSSPLRFDPDRFDPEEFAKIHPYAYIPFSGGPRNCIGPKFAMMAMKTVISEVVRNYKIYTDYKKVRDVKVKADIMIKAANGYRVAFKKRTIK